MQQIQNLLKCSKFYLFFIVYLSFLLDNILLTVVVPIIPDYLFSKNYTKSLSPLQRKYEDSENENSWLGALLASKAFVQLAFTPIIGYVIQKFGCNIPLLLGSFNLLLASILFAYGSSYSILVLARALHGTSSAAIAVSGMTILAKNVSENARDTVMPLCFGGIALGVLIGYPLGGGVYQYFGKSAPFLLIASFIIINISLQVFYLNDEFEDDSNSEEYDFKIDCLDLIKDKEILIVTLAICICTSTMAILEPCIPMWLLSHLQPPPSRWQLGAVFIPDSIGYFVGCHFTGFIPIKCWRKAFIGMVIASLSCYGLPLITTLSQLSIPHFGLGLSVGAVDASLVPLLANLVDKKGSHTQYGPIYALQQCAVSLAYAFGPFLSGQSVRLIGFSWTMRTVGFLNLIICPFLIELDNKTKKETLLKNKNLPSYHSLGNKNNISVSSTSLENGYN